MLEVCISLKPHTPFLVKITSQTIKKVAVINIDGNRYLNLDA